MKPNQVGMTAKLALFAWSIAFCAALHGQNPLSTYTNFEGAQATPLRISADGTRLFAVNTGAARLSVFDLGTPSAPRLLAEIPVGIEPVSVNPRTSDEAWVVNQESDSVSVVSVSKRIVIDTIYLPDEPADVVFAGTSGAAFVSLARTNTVAVIDTTTHQVLKKIPLFGGQPRAMAVSPDGTKVYALFAVSGNGTTIVPSSIAPPQPNPTNPALPPPPIVGKIVSITNPVYAPFLKYTMPDNDVAIIDANALTLMGYYSGVGTLNLGIAVRPGTGDLYVTNTTARNLISFEPNVKGHWVDNQITRILVGSSTVQAFNLNPRIDYTILPNPQALSTALAQPAAAAFDPGGNFLWVASFGTDRVARVTTDGQVVGFVEIGPSTGASVNPRTKRGPRGLAVNGPAHALYVLNRISNTLSTVNTTSGAIAGEVGIGAYDPTPTEIRIGRGFLYDAKLSGNGTGSCASCHLDADMDHLGWDLGDPGGDMTEVVSGGVTFQEHPMKGPLTTQTLRGLAGLAPYHWRGDRPAFESFNGAFQSLMGATALSSADMNAYTAFINTITFMPNPFQNLDRTYPTSLNGGNASLGVVVYNAVFDGRTDHPTCQSCHTTNPGPGSNEQVVLPVNPPPGRQPLKVPQLRNIYQKLLFSARVGTPSIDGFGLTADGTTSTLLQFLIQVFPPIGNNATQSANLIAYMMAFDTGQAPAVGYSRTVTPANANQTAVQSDVALLANQAILGSVDLVVKGTLHGKVHGLLFDPVTRTYQVDQAGAAALSGTQLSGLVRAGDTLTFMGVPPGSGRWMGIDFNLDGILDGDQ